MLRHLKHKLFANSALGRRNRLREFEECQASTVHVQTLAQNLSFLDRREINALTPDEPISYRLMRCIEFASEARVIFRDEIPLVLWGITTKVGVLSRKPIAEFWLWRSEEACHDTSVSVALTIACRQVLERYHRRFGEVSGCSWGAFEKQTFPTV